MAIKITPDGGMIVTEEHIEVYRLLSMKGMLSLEAKGLKTRNAPALKQAVREVCGSKKKQAGPLLEDYVAWLKKQGLLED